MIMILKHKVVGIWQEVVGQAVHMPMCVHAHTL